MSWNERSMLEPRRSRLPLLAGAVSAVMAVLVLGLAAALLFALLGWAFHIVWVVGQVAIIAGLIVIGVRLLTRSRR